MPGQCLSLAIELTKDEIVINRRVSGIVIDTASIFIGTEFERLVRNAGITMVVVSDAVSSFDRESHARSLENMKKLITIVSSKELVDIWS